MDKQFTDDSGYPKLDSDIVDLMAQQFSLFCKKQRDYGPGNINAFGEFGVLVRVNDKVERLKNLTRTKDGTIFINAIHGKPENESVDDTWMDIATYALIALLIRRGQWPK